jgi:recombination protein RecT
MNAITPVTEIKNALVKMQDTFAASLPKHIPADRFIAVAQTALINAPHLAGLDRQSLYQAFMQAAQDGLMPDGREAAIIPFAGKAKYSPMVGGICKKIRNSGEIASVDAQSVYAADQYDAWVDERGPHFKHVRARGDRGEYILTYAYAIGKDGTTFFEEIEAETMAAIKKQALSKLPPDKQKNSPWNSPFEDEMRRKSGLRRLGKYRLPNSSDLSSVFERDDEDEIVETTQDDPKTTPTRLGAIIEAQAEPTLEQAVELVQEVIPEAKVVSPKPVAPKKDAPAPKTSSNSTIKGLPQDLQAKDGVGANGKEWRRFAVKMDNEWYGTFDTKINDQLMAAVDSKKEVTVEYVELVKNGKTLRNIVSVTQAGAPGDDSEAFEMVDDNDIPI